MQHTSQKLGFSRRFRRKTGNIHLVCGCLLSLLFAFLALFKPTLFDIVEKKIYDAMVRSLPQNKGSGIPVIVDLDEESLAEFG